MESRNNGSKGIRNAPIMEAVFSFLESQAESRMNFIGNPPMMDEYSWYLETEYHDHRYFKLVQAQVQKNRNKCTKERIYSQGNHDLST